MLSCGVLERLRIDSQPGVSVWTLRPCIPHHSQAVSSVTKPVLAIPLGTGQGVQLHTGPRSSALHEGGRSSLHPLRCTGCLIRRGSTLNPAAGSTTHHLPAMHQLPRSGPATARTRLAVPPARLAHQLASQGTGLTLARTSLGSAIGLHDARSLREPHLVLRRLHLRGHAAGVTSKRWRSSQQRRQARV